MPSAHRPPQPKPQGRAARPPKPPSWQAQLRNSQPPPLSGLKELQPRTAGHARYLQTLQDTAVTVVVALGPAGEG